MKRELITTLSLLLIVTLSGMRVEEQWEQLLDKNMSRFENYLSYAHTEDYNGSIPKDAQGKPVAPIGYNKDQHRVFSIIDDPSGPILRISGEIYGALFTKQSYKNYHLTLQVRWGNLKHNPRKRKLKDSGILYHSNGEAGAEYWRSWMLSQEFQIMEGHMGDFWCQATGMIDIRSFPSEGTMNRVADSTAPFGTLGKGGDIFCMRSGNYETPNNGWNTLELICFEGKSLHIVNGKVVMILKNSRYKAADGTEVPMDSGKIQLQSEGAEVLYRDIRIRPLKSMPAAYTKLF
ncbi:hypothetical protein HNQ91_000149 [Filimonas zeae]|uniref:3-keto-alpha-glucoside-1,2-lyase/3-keto-2-hydroxy-glucal hydratase domain-containing protein n=1 Tax=Filimonas zeae TaxID=1737353 RepID=A0A917IMQ6_9BACT|nr:DUF1080 domain-containing protein [Filimonas zeae]MDR6337127.1 hypothetical protein [Filimonas zeae]GGH57127.1 hypothetical protein GCM10011379_01460 [Filimonas zeae]